MESYATSQVSGSKRGRSTQPPRRVWTVQEEKQLLVGLKEIISRGWKTDNGFKTGYLGVLEEHMRNHFPGTDIKADPHIGSKIHVWKKNYGTLSTMLSRSGFGWNSTANVIEVDNDQVWNEYCKFDPNARTMRLKAFPYYKEWSLIFGKDRATGEAAENVDNALHEILTSGKGKKPMATSGDYYPIPTGTRVQSTHVQSDEESEFMSTCNGDNDSSPNNSKKNSTKKRSKAVSGLEVQMMDMMSTFFEKTDIKLGDLVCKMGYDDVSYMKKKVFESLDEVPDLSMDDRMKVTSRICEKNDFEIFFTTSMENRMQLIHMILAGTY